MTKIGRWLKVRAMRKITKKDVRYFPEKGEIELARGGYNAKVKCELFENEGKDFLKLSGDSVIADKNVMVALFKVLWNEEIFKEEQKNDNSSPKEAVNEEAQDGQQSEQEEKRITFADMSQSFIAEPTEIFFRMGVHVRLD